MASCRKIIASTIRLAAAWYVAGPLGFTILGLLAYELSLTGDRWQFVAVSFVFGLAVGFALNQWKEAKSGLILTEVELKAAEFSSFKFVVNNEHRRVAWCLFVEVTSRIATQPIDRDHGYLKEALDSLYSLFGSTREVLKTMDPSKSGDRASVEILALSMLNNELRPFLSKWHPKLDGYLASSENGDESGWSDNQLCRSELEALRLSLVRYAKSFGELAGLDQFEGLFGTE